MTTDHLDTSSLFAAPRVVGISLNSFALCVLLEAAANSELWAIWYFHNPDSGSKDAIVQPSCILGFQKLSYSRCLPTHSRMSRLSWPGWVVSQYTEIIIIMQRLTRHVSVIRLTNRSQWVNPFEYYKLAILEVTTSIETRPKNRMWQKFGLKASNDQATDDWFLYRRRSGRVVRSREACQNTGERP